MKTRYNLLMLNGMVIKNLFTNANESCNWKYC